MKCFAEWGRDAVCKFLPLSEFGMRARQDKTM